MISDWLGGRRTCLPVCDFCICEALWIIDFTCQCWNLVAVNLFLEFKPMTMLNVQNFIQISNNYYYSVLNGVQQRKQIGMGLLYVNSAFCNRLHFVTLLFNFYICYFGFIKFVNVKFCSKVLFDLITFYASYMYFCFLLLVVLVLTETVYVKTII